MSRIPVASLILVLQMTTAAAATERRCGWLDNPTPGNWWLTDRQGEWLIRTQGPEAGPEGMDRIPDLTGGNWVATNGAYGFGCTCLTVDTDRVQHRITRILSAAPLPLTRCQADRRLPRRIAR